LKQSNKLFFGLCINIQYFREIYKYRRFFNGDVVDLKRSDIEKVWVKLDPLFIVQGNQKLRQANNWEYFSLKDYKAYTLETLDFNKRATFNAIHSLLSN
jgi:hypothetical protein